MTKHWSRWNLVKQGMVLPSSAINQSRLRRAMPYYYHDLIADLMTLAGFDACDGRWPRPICDRPKFELYPYEDTPMVCYDELLGNDLYTWSNYSYVVLPIEHVAQVPTNNMQRRYYLNDLTLYEYIADGMTYIQNREPQ